MEPQLILSISSRDFINAFKIASLCRTLDFSHLIRLLNLTDVETMDIKRLEEENYYVYLSIYQITNSTPKGSLKDGSIIKVIPSNVFFPLFSLAIDNLLEIFKKSQDKDIDESEYFLEIIKYLRIMMNTLINFKTI